MVEIIEKEKKRKSIRGKEIFGPYERSVISASNTHGKEIKTSTKTKFKGIEKKHNPIKIEFVMGFVRKIRK